MRFHPQHREPLTLGLTAPEKGGENSVSPRPFLRFRSVHLFLLE